MGLKEAKRVKNCYEEPKRDPRGPKRAKRDQKDRNY